MQADGSVHSFCGVVRPRKEGKLGSSVAVDEFQSDEIFDQPPVKKRYLA